MQLFDSWAGALSPADYERFALPATKRVLDAVSALGVPSILFGVGTGELLGLERRDLDTLRGCVQVRRQAQQIAGLGRTVTAPKSDAGTRTVALPRTVTEEVRQHLGAYVASTAGGVQA